MDLFLFSWAVIIGRGIQSFPPVIETGPMARTIPGMFLGVPLQLASQMGTSDRYRVYIALLVLIHARFFPLIIDNSPFSPGQLIGLGYGNIKKPFEPSGGGMPSSG